MPADRLPHPGPEAPSVHELPDERTLLATRDLVVDVPQRPDGAPLNLTVNPGQCWGILGPNGAGKSTLLHTLAGLRDPRAGQVGVRGRHLSAMPRAELARHLGLVFQSHHDGFPATVLETALIGRHPYLRPWDIETAEDYALARAALAEMDLSDMESRLVDGAVILHLTINRPSHDPDFVESLEWFAESWRLPGCGTMEPMD